MIIIPIFNVNGYFFSLHVSLLHQKHAWYLQGPEEIVGFPGTGVADSMSSHMGAENQLAINGEPSL